MDRAANSNQVPVVAGYPSHVITIEATVDLDFDYTDLDFLSGCFEDGSMSTSTMAGPGLFFPE
jgi:hypothetical protein